MERKLGKFHVALSCLVVLQDTHCSNAPEADSLRGLAARPTQQKTVYWLHQSSEDPTKITVVTSVRRPFKGNEVTEEFNSESFLYPLDKCPQNFLSTRLHFLWITKSSNGGYPVDTVAFGQGEERIEQADNNVEFSGEKYQKSYLIRSQEQVARRGRQAIAMRNPWESEKVRLWALCFLLASPSMLWVPILLYHLPQFTMPPLPLGKIALFTGVGGVCVLGLWKLYKYRKHALRHYSLSNARPPANFLRDNSAHCVNEWEHLQYLYGVVPGQKEHRWYVDIHALNPLMG